MAVIKVSAAAAGVLLWSVAFWCSSAQILWPNANERSGRELAFRHSCRSEEEEDHGNSWEMCSSLSPLLSAKAFSTVLRPSDYHEGSPNVFFYPEYSIELHNAILLRGLGSTFNLIPLFPGNATWIREWCTRVLPELRTLTGKSIPVRNAFLKRFGGVWLNLSKDAPPFLLRKSALHFADFVDAAQIENATVLLTDDENRIAAIIAAPFSLQLRPPRVHIHDAHNTLVSPKSFSRSLLMHSAIISGVETPSFKDLENAFCDVSESPAPFVPVEFTLPSDVNACPRNVSEWLSFGIALANEYRLREAISVIGTVHARVPQFSNAYWPLGVLRLYDSPPASSRRLWCRTSSPSASGMLAVLQKWCSEVPDTASNAQALLGAIRPKGAMPGHMLTIAIKSHTKNVDRRNKIRQGWMQYCQGNRASLVGGTFSCSVFFCVAMSGDIAVDAYARNEARETGDILFLGNHPEGFGDPLTVKTLAMHTHALEVMDSAYVLGTDDDMFWNIPDLMRAIAHMPNFGVMRGTVVTGRPVRSKQWGDRYYVDSARYSGEIYPPFPSGAGVLMSRDVLETIIRRSHFRPQHPVDDVNIGMLTIGLTSTEISLRHESRFTANLKRVNFLSIQLDEKSSRLDGSSRFPDNDAMRKALLRKTSQAISTASNIEMESPLAAEAASWVAGLDDHNSTHVPSECGALVLKISSPRQGEVLLMESVHFKYALFDASNSSPVSLQGGAWEFRFRQGSVNAGVGPLPITDRTAWYGSHVGADLLHIENLGIRNGPIEFTAIFTPRNAAKSKIYVSRDVVLASPYIKDSGYARRVLTEHDFESLASKSIRSGIPDFVVFPPLRSAAFVTLVYSESYIGGVVALARSLLAVQSKYPLLLLVPPEFAVPNYVVEIENVVLHRMERHAHDLLMQLPEHAPFKTADGYGSGIWLKLYPWRLTAYHRLLLLDADTICLKNIDKLLRLPASVPFAAWTPMYFGATMISFKPSMGTWRRMQSLLRVVKHFRFPEQDFMNLYFASAPDRVPNKYLCVASELDSVDLTEKLKTCAAVDFGSHPCFIRSDSGKSWKPWMPLRDLEMQRDECDVKTELSRLEAILRMYDPSK